VNDYENVTKALATGADPVMLCTTCPWDRYCITPPKMSAADVETKIREAQQEDERAEASTLGGGQNAQFPVRSLMTALVFAGRDKAAELCPVFTLRLRSSAGRTVADLLKAHMQSWDDSEAGR